MTEPEPPIEPIEPAESVEQPVTGGAKPMKAVWQVLTAVAVTVLPLFTDAPNTSADWINAVLVAMGAATVYIAANLADEPVWQYTKAIMSAISAGGVIAVSALSDFSITHTEWYQIIAAVIGVILTYAVPNDTPTPGGRHRAVEA